MEKTQRELFRTELVRIARNASPQSATLRIFAMNLRGLFSVSVTEIEAEVQYLVGKGLLCDASKSISPENKAWHVSAAGRDWLAEQGLD